MYREWMGIYLLNSLLKNMSLLVSVFTILNYTNHPCAQRLSSTRKVLSWAKFLEGWSLGQWEVSWLCHQALESWHCPWATRAPSVASGYACVALSFCRRERLSDGRERMGTKGTHHELHCCRFYILHSDGPKKENLLSWQAIIYFCVHLSNVCPSVLDCKHPLVAARSGFPLFTDVQQMPYVVTLLRECTFWVSDWIIIENAAWWKGIWKDAPKEWNV